MGRGAPARAPRRSSLPQRPRRTPRPTAPPGSEPLASRCLVWCRSAFSLLANVRAIPDLLKQFDTSIESVSWVVTAYNVALACVAFVVARTALRSLDAARLAQ